MMRLLKVGETVFIKRSDGRVHQAMISSINLEMEIVGVEWLEENESKGKEVDISTLLALNEDIIIRAEFAQCSSDVALDSNSKKRKSVAASQRNRIKSSKSRVTGNFDLELPKTRRSVKEKYPRPTRSVIENINSSMDSSNVVKKVGKMEQERMERRRKQAENRAEKMELSRRHADNPHWELCQAIAEHRKKIDFRPLTENDPIEDRLITVCVRKRPINRSERSKKEVDVITVPSKNQLLVHEPKVKVDLTKYLENHVFKFDYTFGEDCSNETVYKFTAQPLIKTIFEKGFATCFAYGQTGSGKTFTMSGDLSKDTRSGKGIYAMAATDIFMLVNSHQYKELNLVVTCSFFEIYSRKVLDLLNNKAELKILEDGKQQVQVVGLTEKVVGSVDDVLELIHQGNTSRTSGQTSANENSSRSHAVFQIYLRPSKQMNMLHGKLSLIDLAGNERGADTLSSTKVVRMEGGEINKSLLALKECIRALGRKGSHLPFRLSKLTQVLRDSFIGNNSKTCMIAMISPGMSSCENTLNTLRYADRVKELCGGDLQLTTISEKCDDIIRIDDTDDETQYDCEEDQELDDNESINEAKFAKERMLAYHQDTLLRLHEFNQKAKYLLKSFDTDQEEYCKNFESLLDNAVAFLLNVKNSVIQHKEWVTRN